MKCTLYILMNLSRKYNYNWNNCYYSNDDTRILLTIKSYSFIFITLMCCLVKCFADPLSVQLLFIALKFNFLSRIYGSLLSNNLTIISTSCSFGDVFLLCSSEYSRIYLLFASNASSDSSPKPRPSFNTIKSNEWCNTPWRV